MGEVYIVGIGLTPRQITLEALNVISKCDLVYVDTYTSLYIDGGFNELEKIIGKKLKFLKREDIEAHSAKIIIESARKGLRVALLVVGDPHIATTHIALIEEAMKAGINIEIIPGISILCAAMTYTGLIPYRFGKVATLVFPKEGIVYTSTYEVVKDNRNRNLHTFLFLDLDAEKGIYMTASEAAKLLLKLEEICKGNILDENTKVIAIARAGSRNSCIVFETLKNLQKLDLGPPPHSIIIPATKLHPLEEEALKYIISKYRSCAKLKN